MGDVDDLEVTMRTRMTGTIGKALAAALIVAVAGAATVALPASAGKKKKRVERTEEGSYVGATGVRGASDSPCAGDQVGCVIFPVNKGEKFVSIEIADAAGEPVWASVYTYGYSDGTDAHEHVCGSSEGPLPLAAGLPELYIVITQTTGGATNPCAGPATQGTVTGTFSNLP
ncbi:MAG: hypothetical protein ACRDJI_00585 [Actinomycetota bacterium]